MNDVKLFLKCKENYLKSKSLILRYLYKTICHKILRRYNAYIPLNVSIGKNVVFPHGLNGIFISNLAVIGNDVVILHQVTIGSNMSPNVSHHNWDAPKIGNNVFIGAGAKLIGGIKVGDNVRVGANCIIVDNIPNDATVVMNKPRIINRNS